jgi:hypothetical protein
MNRAKVTVLFGALMTLSVLALAGAQATTIRGLVAKVAYPGGTETHVWLGNGDKTQEVCLGDRHFLKEQGFTLKVGDVIEVSGKYRDHIFVADSLTAAGRTLFLQCRGRYLKKS